MRKLLSDTVTQQALLTLVVQSLTKGLRVLVCIIIARWVSINDFAQFIFGFTMTTIGCRIVLLGAPQVLSREWGRSEALPEQKYHELINVAHWFFTRGIFLSLVGFLGFWAIHFLFLDKRLAYVDLSVYSFSMILPLFIVQLIGAVFTAQKKVWLGSVFELFFNLSFLFIVLLGVFFSLSLSVVLVVQSMLTTMLGAMYYWLYQADLRLRSQKPNASIPGFLALQLGGVLFSLVDVVVLRILSTADQLAHYSVALQINTLVVFGLMALNQNIFSRLAQDIKQLDRKALQAKLNHYAKITAMLSSVFFIAIIILGYPILLFYGPAYTDAYLALVVLAIGSLFNALSGSTGMILTMSGQERYTAKVFWFALAVNLIMCLCLVKPFGAVGVAISVALSTFLWNGIMLVKIHRTMGLNPTIFKLNGSLNA